MGHIHAAAMAEYAKDAAETDKPWERWEVSILESSDEYRNLLGHPDWAVTRKYRRKPKTILINGHEVPEPSRTHADDYAKCFATETALLENYPAAKVIAVFDHAASQPAAQGMNAPNEWEDIRTLPTCDDLIWLYCQDSNTIDGPIAPEPNLEEYGWSHWAYANAPSTAWIATPHAKQGGV